MVIGDIARIEGETNAEYVLRAEKLLDGKRLADLDKAALAALEEVLSATEAPAAVVAAAREILQRTRGKPVERIEMSGPNGGPIATVAVSDEQLARFVKRHAQKNEANREET